MRTKKTQTGFTLVELMVAVVIVGILLAVAIPSYRENIRQSYRAEVRALLLEDAQFMERFFTINNRYDREANTNNAVALPAITAPKNLGSTSARYSISFNTLDANSFVIQAIPQGGTTMGGDKCGTYTIDNLGRRGNQTNGSSLSAEQIADCWK